MGYTVVLNLRGRRCVVVGGGTVGERKVAGLLDHGASVTVISPRVTPRLAEWARQGRLVLEEREYRPGDLDGAFLVFAATDDPEINGRVFEEAEARGLPANVADDPARCSFYLPAVVARGDLTVAVSTGGKSPALARRIRERLEGEFGPEYAAWLDILGEVRAWLREAVADRAEREAFLFRLVDDPHYLALLRDGRPDEVLTRIRQEFTIRFKKP